MIVYVDDIFMTGDDTQGIEELKTFLQGQFHTTKTWAGYSTFLGIEVVAWSKEGISLSLRVYALDILEETSLMGIRPVETLMDRV